MLTWCVLGSQWKAENNSMGPVLSLYLDGSARDQTQVPRHPQQAHLPTEPSHQSWDTYNLEGLFRTSALPLYALPVWPREDDWDSTSKPIQKETPTFLCILIFELFGFCLFVWVGFFFSFLLQDHFTIQSILSCFFSHYLLAQFSPSGK